LQRLDRVSSIAISQQHGLNPPLHDEKSKSAAVVSPSFMTTMIFENTVTAPKANPLDDDALTVGCADPDGRHHAAYSFRPSSLPQVEGRGYRELASTDELFRLATPQPSQ
jgi:hypothetical protein